MTGRYAGWMALLAQRDAALVGLFALAFFVSLGFLCIAEWKPQLWLKGTMWTTLSSIYSGLVVVSFLGLLFVIIIWSQK